MEIERKWLVDKNNIPFKLEEYKHLEIEQAYISFSPTIRIRKINDEEFILTIKSASKDNGLSRLEYEINITKEEYENLLKKKEGNILYKTRYKVPYDDYIYEIDFFHNQYEGLCYMEIEFEDVLKAKAYKKPDFALEELTSSKIYTNAALARGLLKFTPNS